MLTQTNLSRLEQLASEACVKQDCLLYCVEFSANTLKVTIDREENPINLDDCTKVSHELSQLLDSNSELLDASYELEISSPGVERVLRKLWHFEKQEGETVKLNMKPDFKGPRNLQGKLLRVEGESIIVEIQNQEKTISFDKIHKGKLLKFENKKQLVKK